MSSADDKYRSAFYKAIIECLTRYFIIILDPNYYEKSRFNYNILDSFIIVIL